MFICAHIRCVYVISVVRLCGDYICVYDMCVLYTCVRVYGLVCICVSLCMCCVCCVCVYMVVHLWFAACIFVYVLYQCLWVASVVLLCCVWWVVLCLCLYIFVFLCVPVYIHCVCHVCVHCNVMCVCVGGLCPVICIFVCAV